MKIYIVRIGMSRCIRLPKTIFTQCKLEGRDEFKVENNRLVIHPTVAPRAGWDQAFAEMAKCGDDKLLDRDTLKPTDWDKNKWRW